MRCSNSGQANGTNGSPQTSLQQGQLKQIAASNEAAAKREDYLRKELSKTAPMKIPPTASIKDEKKQGYDQVKYKWKRGEFTYTARWHTKTPGAPEEQGNSWVVERKRAGIGRGPKARRAERHILVGKNKWVPKKKWYDAIRARKNGTATKEQEELLKNGHWKEQ